MINSEDDLQIYFINQLKFIKNIVWFAVPNHLYLGKKTPYSYIAKQKAMGLISGVSDIIIVNSKYTFFVELKFKKNKQTNNQLNFEKSINNLKNKNVEYLVLNNQEAIDNFIKEKLKA